MTPSVPISCPNERLRASHAPARGRAALEVCLEPTRAHPATVALPLAPRWALRLCCRAVRWLPIVSFLVVGAVACAPQLGDACSDSLDCAVDGTRTCDTTQPGGYCLIPGCRSDECPDEGVCVRFGIDERARTFCMRRCGGDGDCRSDYECLEEDPPPITSEPDPAVVYTEIIDESGGGSRFCIESVPAP